MTRSNPTQPPTQSETQIVKAITVTIECEKETINRLIEKLGLNKEIDRSDYVTVYYFKRTTTTVEYRAYPDADKFSVRILLR